MNSRRPQLPGIRPDRSTSAERPLRADAQRNRDKLIAVARVIYASTGSSAPLEDIAREAGVGIGTLYRHFPTRESLTEAVYAAELDEVTSNAELLLDQFPPDVALSAWMNRYATFIQTKRGMVHTLRTGWASGRVASPTTRERVTGAIETILVAGIREGVFRADVDAEDITALILGVFLSTTADGRSEQTGRLLGLVIDALRRP